MPRIHLYVVTIESIQEQGIELNPSIQKTVPYLCDENFYLVTQIQKKKMALA
jgi:hypothetical protein